MKLRLTGAYGLTISRRFRPLEHMQLAVESAQARPTDVHLCTWLVAVSELADPQVTYGRTWRPVLPKAAVDSIFLIPDQANSVLHVSDVRHKHMIILFQHSPPILLIVGWSEFAKLRKNYPIWLVNFLPHSIYFLDKVHLPLHPDKFDHIYRAAMSGANRVHHRPHALHFAPRLNAAFDVWTGVKRVEKAALFANFNWRLDIAHF